MAKLTCIRRTHLAMAILVAFAAAIPSAIANAQAEDDDEGQPAKPAEAAPAPAEPEKSRTQVSPRGTASNPADVEKGATEPVGEGEGLRTHAAKAVPTSEQGYLEGRAEVESPNEAIHTVQKKTYTAANRFELTLYPGAVQLNSKFTNSDGVAIGVDYALQENFALQILGLYNYLGSWAPLTGQLLDNHARPQAADELILQAGALGGFEVAPIYGKFAFYDGTLAQFRFVLNAGAGVGITEVQLSGSTDKFPASNTSYGSTGLRFLGNLGLGFRVLLGERVALRLEIRDLLYTARVNTINGCSDADFQVLNANPATTGFTDGCSSSNFNSSSNQNLDQQHATARNVATHLVEDNSSDVVNNIIFFGGLSILF